jgi:hypothetical protein
VVRLGVREANIYFDAFVPTGMEPSADLEHHRPF